MPKKTGRNQTMLIDRDTLRRLLQQHECSLTKTAYSMGISPQRVEQLMKAVGLKFEKDLVDVEPTAKSLLYPRGKK